MKKENSFRGARLQFGIVSLPERICKAIDYLRKEEGDSVAIFCDNPDFNGQPDNAISVDGQWTNWKPIVFRADGLVNFLEDAVKARKEKEQANANNNLRRDKRTKL